VLRALGFRECRVRHHDAIARVEVGVADLQRAAGAGREEIVRRLKALGFTYVTLDLAGFRSGSMNEAPEPGTVETVGLGADDTPAPAIDETPQRRGAAGTG